MFPCYEKIMTMLKWLLRRRLAAFERDFDYDARYAAESGPGSRDAFVEAVYESLRSDAMPAKK